MHRNYGGVISYNVIASNNFLGCNAYENGALKLHGFSGVVEANLVVDNPYSAGMWFDDLWWNLRVSRNVVIATSNQSYTGIMLEISTGPALLDNNGRSKQTNPLATENLLENNTDRVLRPHHYSPRGGTLLPSMYADVRAILMPSLFLSRHHKRQRRCYFRG